MRYAAADRRSPPSLPQSARVCTYDLSFLGMALDKKEGREKEEERGGRGRAATFTTRTRRSGKYQSYRQEK